MSRAKLEPGGLYALALEARPYLRLASSDWVHRLDSQRTAIEEAITTYLAESDPRGPEMTAAIWRLWWFAGHMDDGRTLLAKVLESGVVMSPPVRADLLRGLGTIVFRQGDNEAAARIFGESLSVAETLDPVRHVDALCDLSRVTLRRGQFAAVRDYASRAYKLAETVPGSEGMDARRVPAHMLAAAARMEGDYAQARRYYEESQNISRELGNEANVAGEHHNLGYVELYSGNLEGARHHFRTALEWLAAKRDMYLLPYCVLDSAVLALRAGEADRAAVLLASAQNIFQKTGAVPDPDDRVEVDRCQQELERSLDPDARAKAFEHGHTLTIDQALELALAD